jgi:hypothetical protein
VTFAQNEAFPKKDNAIITVKFESGAVGNIIYTSMGSKKYPKEQLRVFSNGMVYELDNYVKLNKYGSRTSKKTSLKQDKGIEAEYRYIADTLNNSMKNTAIKDAFVEHRALIMACRETNKQTKGDNCDD